MAVDAGGLPVSARRQEYDEDDVRIRPDTPLLGQARAQVSFDQKGLQIRGGQARVLGGDASFDGGSLPDGASAVSATASRTDAGMAITLTNRHYDQPASVRLVCADAPGQAQGQMLTADSPRVVNSADAPDRVAPAALDVARDGQDGWRVELPPHTIATILIQSV